MVIQKIFFSELLGQYFSNNLKERYNCQIFWIFNKSMKSAEKMCDGSLIVYDFIKAKLILKKKIYM